MDKYINIIKSSFLDIRFWLFIFFLIRLETINLPPLDEHSWRQCITLGVAKSYLEVDPCFFEPKTVICDSRDGILAQEFPILNYIIFLLWKVFGINNWSYRILNLVVATLGVYYFYNIVKRLFDVKTALASAIVFTVSVAFMYARKAMPDVFAVSLCLIGIEYGYRYIEKGKAKDFIFFVGMLSIGLLAKMPAAMVLPFGLFLITFKKEKRNRELVILGGGIVSVLLMAAWYFIWVPWAEMTYQFRLFFPTNFHEGFTQVYQMRSDFFQRFYPIALTSRLAFFFCIVGLLWSLFKINGKMLLLFFFSLVILVFFVLKTGAVFAGHVYYIIPFVPIMSLLAGYGISLTAKLDLIYLVLLFIISIEAVVAHKPDFFIESKNKKYLRLTELADTYIPKDKRILVNGGNGQPWMMYFTGRRGWTVDDRMKDTSWVKGESTVGLRYMLIDKAKWQDSIAFPVIYDDADFRIYKVKD
ncbi:MAG: glycosyltransferase family 39 protein [Saprospiraceae bacterium]